MNAAEMWIDLTREIADGGEVWHRYAPPRVFPELTIAEHGVSALRLDLNEHTATHLDAPSHTTAGGVSVDELDPTVLINVPYSIIDVRENVQGAGSEVGAEAISAAVASLARPIRPGEVLIVRFGWEPPADRPGWWGGNQPGLSLAACEELARHAPVAVGSDSAGCDVVIVDAVASAAHGHRTVFLPAGILIIEGLTHLEAAPSQGRMIALPLRIRGGTGSPLRVLVTDDRPD